MNASDLGKELHGTKVSSCLSVHTFVTTFGQFPIYPAAETFPPYVESMQAYQSDQIQCHVFSTDRQEDKNHHVYLGDKWMY